MLDAWLHAWIWKESALHAEMVDALAHTTEGREMEMDSSRWGVLTLAHTAEFVTAVAVQASIAHVRSSGARRGFVEKLLDFFFRYGELEV